MKTGAIPIQYVPKDEEDEIFENFDEVTGSSFISNFIHFTVMGDCYMYSFSEQLLLSIVCSWPATFS